MPLSAELATCEVCYSELDEKDMVSLSCAHFFCLDCVRDHLTRSIEDGKAMKIKCMSYGCKVDYEDEDVRGFVTEE